MAPSNSPPAFPIFAQTADIPGPGASSTNWALVVHTWSVGIAEGRRQANGQSTVSPSRLDQGLEMSAASGARELAGLHPAKANSLRRRGELVRAAVHRLSDHRLPGAQRRSQPLTHVHSPGRAGAHLPALNGPGPAHLCGQPQSRTCKAPTSTPGGWGLSKGSKPVIHSLTGTPVVQRPAPCA